MNNESNEQETVKPGEKDTEPSHRLSYEELLESVRDKEYADRIGGHSWSNW